MGMPHVEGVQHRWVDIGPLHMHVAEAGAGEPLLLLHGWPQHWYEWRYVIGPLAEHYRVICPDLRGFGWSDAPPGPYDKETLARDVVRLLDALEVDRVRLIGHDWGGFVGFLLCLLHLSGSSASSLSTSFTPGSGRACGALPTRGARRTPT